MMRLENVERLAMLFAPLLFVASMIVIVPYLQELQHLSGTEGARLAAIRNENFNWMASHVLMLIGAGLYVPAFMQITAPIVGARPIFGRLVRLVCVIGAIGLVGQMSIDITMGVMSRQQNIAAMRTLQTAIENEPAIEWLFFNLPNMGFILGMFTVAVYAIVSRNLPSLTGIAIVAGWLVIILLNGVVQYNQSAGHFLIFVGFLMAFLLARSHDDPSVLRQEIM